MFRFIGWFVMTGFALYGATRFVQDHVVFESDVEKSRKRL
jgi:hypothetical protein